MTTNTLMQAVVDQLVDQMEAGAGDWSMPWNAALVNDMPNNATTGVNYRGGNVIWLWMTQLDKEYRTAQWATYKQWASIDAQVRKGEHGTRIFVWKPIERSDEPTTDDTPVNRHGFYSSFVVFNADQVDGYDIPVVEPLDPAALDARVSTWIEALPFTPRPGRPSYSPTLDVVYMPEAGAFHTTDGYVATLAHEAAHWTGHTSRLARTFGKRFGDDTYAAEELVAELSSAFTCAALQQRTTPRLDHAQYLSHWCQMLRADPSILFSVASKAQQATDFLLAYADAHYLEESA